MLTASLAAGLFRLDVRTDGAALYPPADPIVERTRADRTAFHEPEIVVVLLSARANGPRVASCEGLRALKRLHTQIAELPGVDPRRLRSLANLVDPSPGQTLVEIPDSLDSLPGDELQLQKRLARVAESAHGHGLFLSADGRSAALYVPVNPDQDREAFVARLEAWITAHAPAGLDLHLTGPVVAEVTLGRAVVDDLARLVPLVVLVVGALVLAALRSLGALLVSLSKVGIALVWTLGAMGWTGTPLTLVTTILPVVILTMSVTDEIHLLDRFRVHLGDGRSRGDAMADALAELARPIGLKSLTTAAGLLSFTLTSIVPLRQFGAFASLGIVSGSFLSFTFVPALAITLPARAFAPHLSRADATARRRSVPGFLGGASACVGIALVLFATPGILRLESRDSWIENLHTESALVAAMHAYDRTFWGSYRYDVVLTADELAFFQFPTGLRVAERVVEIVRSAPHVAGVVSHLDAYATHARVAGSSPPVSALPCESVRRASEELMIIQARIDLDQYLSVDGRSARVRLFIPNADFARTRELETWLDRELPGALEGSGVRFHRSGELAAAQAVVRSVVANVLSSTAWSIAGVAVVLALALQSLPHGLVCLAPTISGLLILLGIMGFVGIPLGVATGMFAAVTVGVCDDFGIHAFHEYARARGAGVSHREALSSMLARTGRSIAWNTIALSAGLAVLGLSALPPNRRLGLLLAGTMVLCCGMTLLLMPWLLARLTHRAATPSRRVRERTSGPHPGIDAPPERY